MAMQFAKIDAALAATLADKRAGRLPVFISFDEPRTRAADLVLKRYGLNVAPNDRVVSAELSADVLEALSELSCVRSIKLSGRSNLAPSSPLLGARLRRPY